MKKLILTLTALTTFLTQGFSHDIMFDEFLKNHHELGSRLSEVVCEMEQLAHNVLNAETLEEKNLHGEQLQILGADFRSQIQELRKKNAVEVDGFMGTALFAATGNPYWLFYGGGDELPKSKYHSYFEDLVHYGWRVSIAKSKEKADLKAKLLLEELSKLNSYHYEIEITE